MFITRKNISRVVALLLATVVVLAIGFCSAMAEEAYDNPRYEAPEGYINIRLQRVIHTEYLNRYKVYLEYSSNKPITTVYAESLTIRAGTSSSSTTYFSLAPMNITVSYTGSKVNTLQSVSIGYFDVASGIASPYTTTTGAKMYYSGVGGWFNVTNLSNHVTQITY